MNFKHIVIGTLLLVLAVAGAFAQCSTVMLEGDHFRQVEQYQELSVKLVAQSNCSSDDYTLAVFSDLPVKLAATKFILSHETQAISAVVSPGGASPGLYTVHFLMESHQDIAREEFVVKVVETEDPVLVAEAPSVLNIPENEAFDIAIGIENKGEAVINNVIVFIDEDNTERLYSDELESLQPGKKKYVNFHYDARNRGEYSLNYTASAGEYLFKGQVMVVASDKNYPLSSVVTVTGYQDEGYLVNYLVKNSGSTRLSDLFLTIEDAPSGWGVISPGEFSLAPGETKEIELIILYGEETNAVMHLALYEGRVLRAEDKIDFSQARLRGTGLISFADSFEIGIVVLLLAVAVFYGNKIYKKSREKNIDLQSLVPEWLESFWPF